MNQMEPLTQRRVVPGSVAFHSRHLWTTVGSAPLDQEDLLTCVSELEDEIVEKAAFQ